MTCHCTHEYLSFDPFLTPLSHLFYATASRKDTMSSVISCLLLTTEEKGICISTLILFCMLVFPSCFHSLEMKVRLQRKQTQTQAHTHIRKKNHYHGVLSSSIYLYCCCCCFLNLLACFDGFLMSSRSAWSSFQFSEHPSTFTNVGRTVVVYIYLYMNI